VSDTQDQHLLLAAPIGQRGSGAIRYGAAMFFYVRGEMPAEMLEIYRMCSKFDGEDPVKIARFEGISVPPVTGAS
jgi:hypothetical protein